MSGIKLGDAFTRFVVNDQALKESWAGIRFVLLSAKFFDFEIADLLGSRCPVTLNAGDLMQRLWRRYGLGMMYLAPNSLKTRAALIRPAIDILLDRHQKFFDQLRGPQPKLVAKGTTSDGLHTEIDAAQWNRSDRFIDFRNGDVWDKTEGGRMLWSGVSLAERGPAATHWLAATASPTRNGCAARRPRSISSESDTRSRRIRWPTWPQTGKDRRAPAFTGRQFAISALTSMSGQSSIVSVVR